MDTTHQKTFERYLYAGAIMRDADGVAALFTEDGVFEAPLVPPGHPLPRRLEGREAIRAGIGAYHRHPAFQVTVDAARSAYVRHDTADPDVFVVEIDTVLAGAGGPPVTMSLVQIYRLRDGLIAQLRDYFAPPDPAQRIP
ncbi:nuclear transport factor 2 family protein [Actinoplanes sp. NPDC049599]|uniref:nuclear transport factor 2 family protein n=1 Tax=Actinoplanes sp. NPDC049599 TaxID=3363903 RepID=UPI00379ACFD1